ncbi:MAG TPA: NAD(P)-dependent oxidoreductase [Candidatus Paceibacterota bacterium]|nr:NAD(P)-dependent oxidoreductase [Candidatus Paceibacterota bacterium]
MKRTTAPNKKTPKTLRNLVIGSEGFLGSTLCSFLEGKGESVTRFDIKRSKKEDARTANLHLEKFDRVYFLAWEVGGSKYLYRHDTQLQQLNWNIDLLQNVMKQLQKHETPFVFVSSQLADETDTIYGALKKVGELWTAQIDGACVRLWNIYGSQETLDEKSHVISDFVHQAVYKKTIAMMTTGEERRQFTHVLDVCEALHLILEQKLHGAVYDLTTFEWITIREVADIIAFHASARVVPGTMRGVDRAYATIKGRPPGWAPRIRLEEGLKGLIENIRQKKRIS